MEVVLWNQRIMSRIMYDCHFKIHEWMQIGMNRIKSDTSKRAKVDDLECRWVPHSSDGCDGV